MSKRVFSGIQPTGSIHVGNYLGAIRNWVQLQDEYECLFCMVDYHAITVNYDPDGLEQRVLDATATNIAAGLDPDKAIIFLQSLVPEHTELTWLLTCITSIGALERMTQFKDKAARQQQIFAGLMNYPILMAADILLYKAEFVPVGDDQLQHLELARELARRFNGTFEDYFPEPKPLLTSGARIMGLNDPTAKMSKSIEGSYIALAEEDDSIRQKIRRAVTDPGPQGGEMGPGVRNLFTLLEGFADESIVEQFRRDYADQKLRYSDLKSVLADAIVEGLTPIREKRAELLAKPEDLKEILYDGSKKARKIAKVTMEEVRDIMGFRLPIK
ncbi:MAG: tryptophan--tRNA ligase [Firmicutes bacterium]|jgi:tryptophanyl-tRNA synthetase|nr:tryptophan--tRNA ligase [Bacillota bacterium]